MAREGDEKIKNFIRPPLVVNGIQFNDEKLIPKIAHDISPINWFQIIIRTIRKDEAISMPILGIRGT